MKLKLNKKKLKNLSNDNKALPVDMTPMIAGGLSRQCEMPLPTNLNAACPGTAN